VKPNTTTISELPAFGSKHAGRRRSTVELAAHVRDDIVAAVVTGLLPARLRVTVRATGLGIRVCIRACPGVVFLSTRRVRADLRREAPSDKNPILSRDGERLIARVYAIAYAYKNPKTAPGSSFLVYVEFDARLVSALRNEIIVAVTATSRAA
jgi:hypothetical protein